MSVHQNITVAVAQFDEHASGSMLSMDTCKFEGEAKQSKKEGKTRSLVSFVWPVHVTRLAMSSSPSSLSK